VDLPRPPSTISIPDYLSPSSLGTETPCRLRVIASTAENRELFTWLPAPPLARLGLIVHEGIALALSGELSDASEVSDWLDSRLDAPTPSERYECLRSAIAKRRIELARSLLTGKATSRPSRSVDRPPLPGQGEPRMRITGLEVVLKSKALRIQGRADLIRRGEDGALEIVDFKTGDVTGRDGEVRRAYALQIQAYALMVREREPETPIRLFLDNGSETAVPADPQSLAVARDSILNIAARLPARASVSADSLAEPGPECAGCSIRPSCPSYLAEAPSWWHDIPATIGFAPPDTWGEVKTIETAEGETSTLGIVDAAGRSVRIRDIDSAHGFHDSSVGTRAHLFSLVPDVVRRGFSGERPHPRLFHELAAADAASERAWSACVFRDG